MPGALLTDLYELNMAASYLRRGMVAPATFSLYVRNLPPQRGFLVSAGLEPCLAFLDDLSFEAEDLAYLSTIGFDDRALADFDGLRFDGEVWAVPEGRVVYADEPLLEVTASLPVAQIVESYLLNQITVYTTLASKAARYVIAAQGRDLVDFALRRSHGVDAALAVARSSAMVGFVATSNVAAAHRLGLQVAGTMAHSFVEAFASEGDAFRAFAEDHPERTVFLVDTYDTPTGVRSAIETARSLAIPAERLGIRLDSGDVASLALEARGLLDAAGLQSARIFASGGLDEHEIGRLVDAGAPIDAFGVGGQLGVSADAPLTESVYKLTEYDGRPTLKLSAAKATAPGRKQVWRGPGGDLIGLREEDGPDGGEPLLVPVMRDGRRTEPASSIQEGRRRFEADLARAPADASRLVEPAVTEVPMSDALRRLTASTRERVMQRVEPAG